MTEQELLQEALEWREHIAKLAADYSDQELFRKRLATFDWLIKQAERAQELEQQNKNYRKAIKGCIERMNEGGAGTRSFVYEKLTKALEGEE